MMQRGATRITGLFLVLLIAGSHLQTTRAEEEETAIAVDLAQILEGFAPLAKHGTWIRSEVKPDFASDGSDISEASRQGLQSDYGVKFSTPDNSKVMGFVAARFETSAQAKAFLEAAQKEFQRQTTQQASHPSTSVWLQDISKGAGKDSTLDGYAIELAADFFGTPMGYTHQHLHVDRLYVSLTLIGCSHVTREAQDAFIAYALERLTNPNAKVPPSPTIEVPTREVTLHFRDPDGKLVASADVTASVLSMRKAGAPVRLRNAGTMKIPREVARIRVGHALGQDGRPLPLLSTEITLNRKQTEATVTLPRGEPYQIQVVGPDGDPVVGAEVRTLPRRRRRAPQIRIQMRGEYLPQKERLPPMGDGKGTTDASGKIQLPVDPNGGSTIVVDAGEDYFPSVEEATSGTSSTTIRLRPAWVLHLLVQDPTGTPVAGHIEIRVEGKTRLHSTDATGRVEIGPLQRAAIHVRASLDDLAGEAPWTEVKPSQDRFVLLIRSRVLQLRVLGPDGVLVPKCSVDVSTGRRAYGTDAEGPTTILVPPQHCTIEVRNAEDADGHPLNFAAVRTSIVRETGELTLSMKRGLIVTGTVKTADGKPVVNADVRATRNYDTYALTKTNAKGYYKLVGLDRSSFKISVKPKEGIAPSGPQVIAPSDAKTSLDIVLPKVVPIKVIDWRGEPISGAWVRVKVTGNGPNAGNYPIGGHTNDAGIAYLANLYPDQELQVMPQNSKNLASYYAPWNGSPTTVRLERARTVQVRVMDTLGPVTGARVEIEGSQDFPNDTGPEGNTRVDLPNRPVRVRARRSYSAPASAWMLIKPSETSITILIPDA